jgi:hypothetical protein
MPDDQSAMIDHSVTMSPGEATSALDGMVANLRGPVPLMPTTTNEARQRPNALSSDPAWVKKYFEGDMKTRGEVESLNQTIANGTVAEALAGGPVETPAEVTTGPDGLRRQDLLSAAADLRRLWSDSDNCEAAIAEVLNPDVQLDPNFVQGMRDWKAQAMNDPAFIEMLMRGDVWAAQRMTLCNAVIALGTEGL